MWPAGSRFRLRRVPVGTAVSAANQIFSIDLPLLTGRLASVAVVSRIEILVAPPRCESRVPRAFQGRVGGEGIGGTSSELGLWESTRPPVRFAIHRRAPVAREGLNPTISEEALVGVAHISCTHSFRTNRGHTDARIDRLSPRQPGVSEGHGIPSVKRSGCGWPCARLIRATMMSPGAGQATVQSATAPSGAPTAKPVRRYLPRAARPLSASSNPNSVGFRNLPRCAAGPLHAAWLLLGQSGGYDER